MPGKLRSRWNGPFKIINIFPHDVVEIQDFNSNKVFKVNGHRLKPFYEGLEEHTVHGVQLDDLIY